ncbi:MAG: 2-amino-4-hydroxy-6-hydroxymethyldihydropteridine diphosphokinase, partial [Pirellulales bacterium]
VAFVTSLTPQALHAQLQQIERDLGRQRAERWSARTIDLDLLLYGEQSIETPDLVVPHPRMAFRRFVVEPAADVAPQMVHPAIGWSMARLLAHLDMALPYVALLGMPRSGKSALAHQAAVRTSGRYLVDPTSGLPPPSVAASAAGPDLGREIELLDERARLLDRAAWPDPGVPRISDFHFDQCLAYAELRLGAAEFAAFRQEFERRADQVVLPKLLVVLDTRPSTAPDESPTTGAPGDEDLRRRLLALTARPGLGPVLYVGRHDPLAQLNEVSAAIEAMQSPSIDA